jgi:hypothetical protein
MNSQEMHLGHGLVKQNSLVVYGGGSLSGLCPGARSLFRIERNLWCTRWAVPKTLEANTPW